VVFPRAKTEQRKDAAFPEYLKYSGNRGRSDATRLQPWKPIMISGVEH